MDAANRNALPEMEMPRLLSPFRRAIEATAQPALALTGRGTPGAVSGTRFGGVPLVSWGTAWPQSPRGPMAFIGQLNFAQLSQAARGTLPDLPSRGVLCLFYDLVEQRWGFDPEDRQWWRVTWVPDAEQAVALVPPPAVRDAVTPLGLVPSVCATLPSPGDESQVRFPAGFSRYLVRSYGTFHGAFRRQQLGVGGGEHQVHGHPCWLGPDARAIAELASAGQYCGGLRLRPGQVGDPVSVPGGWRLLWQVASDEAAGLRWGDGGTLYVLIREADLRAGAFGRAWVVVQSLA
jgi:uncharacterized protein YwqG